MAILKNLNYFVFLVLTFGAHNVYLLKCALNVYCFGYLGYLTCNNYINEYVILQIFYVIISMLVNFFLVIEGFLISNSSLFQLVASFNNLIYFGTAKHPIYNYGVYRHVLFMSFLSLLQLGKILGCAYCIFVLAYYNIPNILVTYITLGIIISESLIGLFLYLSALFCIVTYNKFFYKWLKWMGKYYWSDMVEYDITLDERNNIECKILGNRKIDTSPPNVLGDLSNSRRRNSSIVQPEEIV